MTVMQCFAQSQSHPSREGVRERLGGGQRVCCGVIEQI